MFGLVPLEAFAGYSYASEDDDETEEMQNKSLSEQRTQAMKAASSASRSSPGKPKQTCYQISKEVSKYILARANGECEACKQQAPFMIKKRLPYLEPHYIRRLSDGGLTVRCIWE